MRLIRRAATLAAAALSVVLVAGPAGAVIGGTTDTANVYANVGVLQLNVDGDSGPTSARGPLSAPMSS